MEKGDQKGRSSTAYETALKKARADGKKKKSNKLYSITTNIHRNFCNLDRDTFKLLHKSLMLSHIEYGDSVWNPYWPTAGNFILKGFRNVLPKLSKVAKN